MPSLGCHHTEEAKAKIIAAAKNPSAREHWTTVFQAMAIKRSIAELDSKEPVQSEEG